MSMAKSTKYFVTISQAHMYFASLCVNAFDNNLFIYILINPETKCLMVKKASASAKDAVRWGYLKHGTAVAHFIESLVFGHKLYDLMKWDWHIRYKIWGVKKQIAGEDVFVFDLKEAFEYGFDPKIIKNEQI